MIALSPLRAFASLSSDLLGAAVRWLIERPVRLLILALILLSAWLWIGREQARALAEDRRVQAAEWRGKFAAQKAEMGRFVDMVRAARIEAARIDQDNIRRVQAQWTANLAEVKHDYQADLAAARAAVAGRMRQSGAGAGAGGDPGDGAGAVLPALPVLSSGAMRPGEAAIVDGADIDAVTENTVRLEHLIDAWNRAARIAADQP